MPVFLFYLIKHRRRHTMSSSYDLGLKGEALAADHLRSLGMHILETRWRDHSFETDIIAFDHVSQEVVFVEVKTRVSGKWGEPEEAITPVKIRRLVASADHYMKMHHDTHAVRFDVFSIILPPEGMAHIDYYRDAFYAPLR